VFLGLGTGNTPITKQIRNTTLACIWGRPFPVNGQGVFIFNTENKSPIFLSVENANGDNSLGLYIENIKTPCPLTGNGLPHMHARVVFRICLVIGVLPVPNPAKNILCVYVN
jgi:hypothetical protein